MPKLLSINNYHYRRGGADILYLEHAAMMEAAGWEPAYFSMQHPKNLPTPWSEYFIEEIELGRDYSLYQKITKSIKAIYSFEARRNLGRLLDNFDADIAHLHNIYHHLSPSILATLHERGVPVVLTSHDLKIACPNYQMLNHLKPCERCKGGKYYNAVIQRCVHDSYAASTVIAVEAYVHAALRSYRRFVDRIVVPSRFFMEKFVEWGWDRERFVHIPNFAEVGDVAPEFTPGKYFVYFGRISLEKGVGTLIRATAQAKVPLKIVGTGPEADRFMALARQMGAEVEFLGFRSGDDLFNVVKGARAVVLPSEANENAPLSILESFALGKPVIGASSGGIPEMVLTGETGWVFRTADVANLAEVLAEVAVCPDERISAMGQYARHFVRERFSKAAYLAAVQKLYAELAR